MAREFLTPINLNYNELQSSVVWNVVNDPTGGALTEGLIWFNTSTSEFKYYDGTNIQVIGTSSATGTVTSVSVASANGFAGTVATSTTTPAITIQATPTGILKSNGTAISAATAGTDYITPTGSGAGLTGITVSQVSGAAPLASPALTGTPTAPTATTGDSSTTIATTAFVATAVADFSAGLDTKPSALVVSTSNLTLSGTQTVDGVSLVATNRVLATGQSTASQNGLWVVASGSWTRPADFASASTQQGAYVFIEAGTAGQGSGWVLVGTTATVVDTSSQTWTQFSGAGEITAGAGLAKSGNTLSIENSGVLTVSNGGTGVATLTGLVKGNGTSAMTAAVSGTDYAPATSGSSILKGNGSGGFSAAKYTATIGDGSSTSITVTHSLGTRDVVVAVYDASTYVEYSCDVTRTSTSVVTLGFATAPASDSLNVVVIG